MKRITLTTAILLAIKSFGDYEFSIHNITKWIRNEVNNGNFEITYLGDSIPHDEVKDAFQEIVDNGLLEDYSLEYKNGYRSYSKKVSDSGQIISQPNPQTTIPTDIQLTIYKYMKNNGPVTMKQIQSRLKGHPYTCEEIAQFLDKINLIDPSSKLLPYSKMNTVSI